MVAAVKQLVAHERKSLQAADTIAAAEQLVGAGDTLLARVVAHFQHLFDCPRLEGVLPAINQVSAE
jgi:fructose-1-phosphate kinase PfkB-like protein